MKTSEAIEMLRRMQEPEPYEPQISEKAFDALEMAIDALHDEIVRRQINEDAKENKNETLLD